MGVNLHLYCLWLQIHLLQTPRAGELERTIDINLTPIAVRQSSQLMLEWSICDFQFLVNHQNKT